MNFTLKFWGRQRGGRQMEISEVRIFLKRGGDRKLKAYASVTFGDSFVVRNIKVIEGKEGVFVAMPSRKLKHPCPSCGYSNPLRSKFCNQCGRGLHETQAYKDSLEMNRQTQHRDIAHPINAEFREYFQSKVLEAYKKEQTQTSGKSSTMQEIVEEKETIDIDDEF